MSGIKQLARPLTTGKEIQVFNESVTAAGTSTQTFALDAETVLISLAVLSTSGTIDVKVLTQGGPDAQELEIIEFPTISAATTSLVMKKAAQALQRVRVEVTYTDACSFNIRARGIAGGAADVRVLGATTAVASQKDISTVATVIVPTALTDRSGVVVKNNNSGTGKLYIGFTAAEATLLNGYPVGPQEALALDVAAGVAVYGIADAGTIDIRLLEAGG